MDRQVNQHELLDSCPPSVSQHAIKERQSIPRTEAVWATNARHPPLPPAHRRAFTHEWQRKQNIKHSIPTRQRNNQHAHPLPVTIGSHVAIHNKDTKHWDRYGLVVDIGKHRQYFIKTMNGRILVRNRRFIRKRVPTSLPEHITLGADRTRHENEPTP